MKKKYLVILLVISLFLGNGLCSADGMAVERPATGSSQGIDKEQKETYGNKIKNMPTGRIHTKTRKLPEKAVEQAKSVGKEGLSREKSNKASAIYHHSWDKYANYYFYNQFSDKERGIYDALDDICQRYLTSSEDAEQEEEGCYLQPLKIEEKDLQDLQKELGNREEAWQRVSDIVFIFQASNPQYYFLDSSIWSDSTNRVVALGVYRVFASGQERQTATETVQTQLDNWEAQIENEKTDEDKVKLIHDLITDKVTYNYDIEDEETFDDEEALTQSVYSVLCMDETVCMGYSEAFALLCNGADIDAVTVTSLEHAWNKVRVNDSWYNVDCTWDDSEDEGRYDFFERSDSYLDRTDSIRSPMHKEESVWEDILPVCSLDSNPPDEFTPGTLPVITNRAASPLISFSEGKAVLAASTENAKIYYALDDTAPSPGSVKCYLYKGAFTVSKGMTITAVTVCDTYLDSEAAECTVKDAVLTTPTLKPQETLKPQTTPSISQTTPPTGYRITYKLNGGKNNKGNPSSYMSTSADIVLQKPTKKGYTFKGWYEDSSFQRKVTRISRGSIGNRTLYAKWQANKYKVVFKGNGRTKGKMSSMTSRKYGKSFRLKANKFKRKGWRFAGWSTKKNGKGKRFANRQKVKNLTSKANGKVTLYARWKRK